jgi:hypothetical protein
MRGNSKRRRATGAVAAATIVLAAACSGPDPGKATAEPTEAASDPITPPAPEVSPSVVVDTAHAMDPPGPFQPPAVYADILITSDEAIPAETVAAIEKLEGVEAVAPISIGQAAIEGRVYDLAAVDAATYRRFTPAESAQLQAQWDRVAGGELAILPELQKRLPTDDQGFVRLGPSEDDPLVHVGAYAPQIPTIELVVNEKWGESLDLTQRNALVVSTFETAPQGLRKPVQQIAGETASVQLMDAATLNGLDPAAYQKVELVGSFTEAVGVFNYTVSGGRVIPDPAWVREHIATETVPILGQVTCNKAMLPQLKAALSEIVSRGLADEVHPDEYAGCYYPRFIAGSTQLSNHAFGLALDLNVPGNLRGTVGEMDRGVVDSFKKWGFSWGGDWNYTDPMHFELNRIVNPG